MRIAYVIQNVGNIDFSQDVGDTVPVKNSLLGLQNSGHEVDCYRLFGQSVVRMADVSSPEKIVDSPLGLTGTNYFRSLEGGIRRIQKNFKVPYFAFFDSYRFYEGCRRFLPKYDLCHEHNGLFSVGASLACSRLRTPYVLTFSADPLLELELVGKPLRGVHKTVARKEAEFSYQVADRIICVSKQAKDHLVEVWHVAPEKIFVLPNGVDIQLFSQVHDAQRLRMKYSLDENLVIGFVGGFQPWHGIDLLVESFSQVLRHHPTAQLLLIGDGPARQSIELLVKKLELEKSVKFAGLVAQNRVPEFLSAIDVAVIPYPQLPKDLWFSPLKLYEYMAAGKAIVAANSGQIAEVIKDGTNGILVPPGMVADLTEAIINLLNNADLRKNLGKNAQNQAIKRHSWENYIHRLESVYTDVFENSISLGEQQGEPL